MTAFQIIFVLVNLAVPIWWFSRSSHTQYHAYDWPVLEKNLDRLIDSDGGFPPCNTQDLSDLIKGLCEESMQKLTPTDTTAIEHASKHVVFYCEARKNAFIISWRLEENPNERMSCAAGGELINYGPGFEFALDGRIRNFEFWSANRTYETIPYRNCRVKALRAKSEAHPPPTREDFLNSLARVPHDPEDERSANEMCLTFDSSPLWNPWRQRYRR